MMLEVELFSDLASLKSFHDAHFAKEMAWSVASDDLTDLPGFQAHQMAARFHVMACKLDAMQDAMMEENADPHGCACHCGFKDFRLTLASPGVNGEMQVKKARSFAKEALTSHEKHFPRCCMAETTPTGLCAEPPIAKCVARAMLKMDLLDRDEDALTVPQCKSKAHG